MAVIEHSASAKTDMQHSEILDLLQTHKHRLANQYGVTRLGVFGSVVHNDATSISDVDIVVEMPPDLFKMVHLKEELENLLVTSVDLIRYQKHLNALLKKRIDSEAIYVCLMCAKTN